MSFRKRVISLSGRSLHVLALLPLLVAAALPFSRVDHRRGTGSGSDRVLAEKALSRASGRYRSRYRTDVARFDLEPGRYRSPYRTNVARFDLEASSEYSRPDPFGGIVEADRDKDQKRNADEADLKAIQLRAARNGYVSFHLMVKIPQGGPYSLS